MLYKPLCFKNNANIRRDPGYWADTYRSTVLRNLVKEDQDIWVNLHHHGTKQRAILMRSLRKYKPMCVLLDETMEWTECLTEQLLEEEITVNIPLRRIIEVTDKIDNYIESSDYAVVEKAWPGYLNDREKEIWNELDRLAKEWEGKDCVERPSMPEYRQRELNLFMDDYKSNELLKIANPKVIWRQGSAEDLESFTERDYAVAWRRDLDWNLEFARRNPTVFQEFPKPYLEEQKPKDRQEPFPNAVTKLKYGEEGKNV